MTSILVLPEALGFDAASFKNVTNFARVKGAPGEAGSPNQDRHGEFVSLYIGGNHGISRTQLEAAWAVGLPVMPNFERAEDAAVHGYPTGRDHALTCMQQLEGLGFQGESPVIFSGADSGIDANEMPAVMEYHRALVENFRWVGGAYGPRNVLERLAQADWWPDHWPLWHWGGDGSTIYPWTWVKQGPGPSYFNLTIGFGVDDNVVYRPIKMWSGYGADKLEPDDNHPQGEGVPMASHITYAQAPDGSFVSIMRCLDGLDRWKRVGDVHGAGAFYACHPGGAGVNPVGGNELGEMGEYDAAAEARWFLSHGSGGGSVNVDVDAIARAVNDETLRRMQG